MPANPGDGAAAHAAPSVPGLSAGGGAADLRRNLALGAAGLLAGGALLALSLKAPPPLPVVPPEQAMEQGEFGPVPEFQLTDQKGRLVARGDIRGPWVANFLFTSCSGLCPMMAARLRGLEESLPGIKVVSFSVDSNDSPEDLARFAKKHRADWLFLTGGPGVVKKLSMDGFKLAVAEGKSAEEPILHTDRLVLVDAAGMIRGYYHSDDDEAMARLVARAKALGDLGATSSR